MIVQSLFNISVGGEEKNMTQNDIVVTYTGSFHFNEMGCIYSINGLVLTESINYFGGSHDNISFMDDIGSLLQEGENTIEIKAIHLPTQPKNGGVAFCELSVNATAENRVTGESQGKEVTNLRVTLNGEGKFTTEQSKTFEAPTVTTPPTLVELNTKAVDSIDWLNNDVIAKRTLQVNHPHDVFAWTKTKPFENTPQNIARVWLAYEEVIQALREKNEEKLAEIFMPAAKERDLYTGYEGEGSRRWNAILDMFRENWQNYGYTPIPYDRKDYELETSNNGKLFRLKYKGANMASPIEYKAGDSSRIYNFYFTEVNGKIRPAMI